MSEAFVVCLGRQRLPLLLLHGAPPEGALLPAWPADWPMLDCCLAPLCWQAQHEATIIRSRSAEVWWNWLDLIIVISGIVEQVVFPLLGSSIGGHLHLAGLRALRLLRCAMPPQDCGRSASPCLPAQAGPPGTRPEATSIPSAVGLVLDTAPGFRELHDGHDCAECHCVARPVQAPGAPLSKGAQLRMWLELDYPTPVWKYVEHAMLIIYTFELTVRVGYHGCRYFVHEDWTWHYLDFCIEARQMS